LVKSSSIAVGIIASTSIKITVTSCGHRLSDGGAALRSQSALSLPLSVNRQTQERSHKR
jgi:hypothetical protein